MQIFINSIFSDENDARISPLSDGFLYGFGVFETIKVKNGNPVFLAEHYQRLVDSLAVLGLSISYGFEEITGICGKLIGFNCLENGFVKIMCAKESLKKAGTVIYTGSKVYNREYESGFKLCMAAVPKNEFSKLCYIKSINCAENIIQRETAAKEGFNEALFINTKGIVCEGCVSNMFWVKGNTVFTPAVQCGLLPGIIRTKVLALCGETGIHTVEGEVRLNDIESADEIFLTNSLMDIMPVSVFGNKKFDIANPGLTNRMMNEYKQRY